MEWAGTRPETLPRTRVTFRIVHAGEAAVRIGLRIHDGGDAASAQLVHNAVQASHAEVEHPGLTARAEIVGVFGEGRKCSVPCLLLPWQFLVTRGDQ